jgi:hypothetical protein
MEQPITVAEATQRGPLPVFSEVMNIVALMKTEGVKRLAFMSGQVHEIELFKACEAPIEQ